MSKQQPLAKGKVMLSGCFDLFHAGHVEFLRRAANFGSLHVVVGSDNNVKILKGRVPINNQRQRLETIKAIRWVDWAQIGSGHRWLDFEPQLRNIRPQTFIVNEDGDRPEKQELCESLNVQYTVLSREPARGVEPTSTSTIRSSLRFPYRIEIAGGWLDHPLVSQHLSGSGPVIVAQVEADEQFQPRGGMASSARNTALELWGGRLPQGDPEQAARILFAYDNMPGRLPHISGSQDHLGLLLSGINRLDYSNGYWPSKIKTLLDEATLTWFEQIVRLVPLNPRIATFDPQKGMKVTLIDAISLARASDDCWEAILAKDAKWLGRSLSKCLEAQTAMFPAMVDNGIQEDIAEIEKRCYGCKMTGAGGGGYVIAVSESEIEQSLSVRIRRDVDRHHPDI